MRDLGEIGADILPIRILGISLDVNGPFSSTWCTFPVCWRPKVEETPQDADAA